MHKRLAALVLLAISGTFAQQAARPPSIAAGVAEKPAVADVPSFPKADPNYRFPTGQTLVYGAEWRIFHAGSATLRMEQAGQEQRVVGEADATGAVALLFHIHDRFESFFDSSNLCSRNISKNVEEGLRKVDTNISFDYQKGKAVL